MKTSARWESARRSTQPLSVDVPSLAPYTALLWPMKRRQSHTGGVELVCGTRHERGAQKCMPEWIYTLLYAVMKSVICGNEKGACKFRHCAVLSLRTALLDAQGQRCVKDTRAGNHAYMGCHNSGIRFVKSSNCKHGSLG